MAVEVRKAGHPVGRLVLALLACLMLGALTASTASAISFQIEEGAELPLGLDVSSESTFHTNQYISEKVICDEGAGGEATLEHQTAGTVSLALHGCHVLTAGPDAPCTSPGAESGTVETQPLAMDLAELPKEEEELNPPGIVLDPVGVDDQFAEFTCTSGVNIEWTGGLIGEITDPYYWQASRTISVDFVAGESGQQYTETADGREAFLVSHRNEAEGKVIGLTGDLDLDTVGGYYVTLLPEDGETFLELARPGGFPASATWYEFGGSEGGETVLHLGSHTITCTVSYEEEAWKVGSGEFTDSVAGEAQFTLKNCKESTFNSKCTSSGQSAGTIQTEWLPVQLAFLSDGSPGTSLKQNAGSGKLMEMTCVGGLVKFKVTGGALGKISQPKLNDDYYWLATSVNAVEEEEGFGQEYTETYDSEEVVLKATINGGAPQSASMDSSLVAGLGGEGVTLRGYLATE